MRPRLLNTESFCYCPEAKLLLNSFADVTFCDKLTRRQLLEKVCDVDGLIVRFAHKIDKQVIDQAKRLKVIATAATGTNHIDVDYAKTKGMDVLSLKGETKFLKNIAATAELTLALMLALIRKIPAAHNSVQKGLWDRNLFFGEELSGKTLGIVGYGRLGTKVARLASAFGMTILVYDPLIKKSLPRNIHQCRTLKELLQHADIISVHVALNENTVGLLGKAEFRNIKKGSYLVNTSRGQVVEEQALIQALRSGQLKGAALDVLAEEEAKSFNLKSRAIFQYARKNTNLILTPHIGGATVESMKKTEIFMAQKLKHYFQKKDSR
ncbi:MAG: hypothetical protein HQL24_05435 [Candidatus Omnitrophica bacterium]|nr:hypothetical protein [Candidatus Omnitrophota bacterium]